MGSNNAKAALESTEFKGHHPLSRTHCIPVWARRFLGRSADLHADPGPVLSGLEALIPLPTPLLSFLLYSSFSSFIVLNINSSFIILSSPWILATRCA